MSAGAYYTGATAAAKGIFSGLEDRAIFTGNAVFLAVSQQFIATEGCACGGGVANFISQRNRPCTQFIAAR